MLGSLPKLCATDNKSMWLKMCDVYDSVSQLAPGPLINDLNDEILLLPTLFLLDMFLHDKSYS